MTFDQALASPAPAPAHSAARHEDLAPATSVSSAGTVHDLGNLIQLATSAIGMLSRDPGVRGGHSAALVASAKTSLDRAGALVRQALGRATERSPAAPMASLVACVAEVEAALRGAEGTGLRLDVRLEPGLPPLSCDPLGLQCALLNLVFNAREAMAGRGIVRMRAGRGARAASSLVELQVIDTGIGMSAETVARAFDPFFTTKSDGLGGIGLPMVERFARECGGEVVIDSAPGLGTTVTLRLPFAASAAGRSA